MSGSEQPARLIANADGASEEDALRRALADIARQLGRIGAGPGRLSGMVWTARDPGAIHPSRRAIDLAYREAFGGTRPPVRLRHGAGPGVMVEAEVAPPVAPRSGPVWGGFEAAELAREYSPRGQVADISELLARWSREGAAFSRQHGALDLAYGSRSAEVLDLYRPRDATRPPLWVFIHGGYWQATTKAQHAQFAAGMLAAGFAVANLDYSLAPDVDLSTIVDQIAAALRFLVRESDSLAIAPDALHLAGTRPAPTWPPWRRSTRAARASDPLCSYPGCSTSHRSRPCRSGRFSASRHTTPSSASRRSSVGRRWRGSGGRGGRARERTNQAAIPRDRRGLGRAAAARRRRREPFRPTGRARGR